MAATAGRVFIMKSASAYLPVDIEFKDGAPVQVVMTQGKFEIIDEIDDWQEQAEIARAFGLAD